MPNEKLKEQIVRAACDMDYWRNAYGFYQNKITKCTDKMDTTKQRSREQKRNEANDSFFSCQNQLIRLANKLKEKDPDYEDE